jgi:hypothetical protein
LLSFFFFFFFSFMSRFSSTFAHFVSSASVVGFSGHRSCCPPFAVQQLVFSSVPASASVAVGCARGLDSLVRSAFPSAVVFRASSFGSGASAFARRSSALVSSLSSARFSVFVSFPAVACPAGLFPSSSSRACFCGLGSGSWASLALAVGSGVPSFLWLPSGVFPPVGWGFVSLGGGWFFALTEQFLDFSTKEDK